MAKVRSPNFPAVALGSALVMTRKAFDKDHRNKMSRAALGKHLGHDSLSGPALGKIGALRAYGLLEGSGDELRVTEDAVTAMMAPENSTERKTALSRLAMKPNLFQEIHKEYPTPPSEENLRYWLIKRAFTPDAAAKAAKSYLKTMSLVESGQTAYDDGEELEDPPVTPTPPDPAVRTPPPPSPKAGMLQEVFTLEEGPVTVTFPATLSADSYQDLADHFEIFLRKAKRRATPSTAE